MVWNMSWTLNAWKTQRKPTHTATWRQFLLNQLRVCSCNVSKHNKWCLARFWEEDSYIKISQLLYKDLPSICLFYFHSPVSQRTNIDSVTSFILKQRQFNSCVFHEINSPLSWWSFQSKMFLVYAWCCGITLEHPVANLNIILTLTMQLKSVLFCYSQTRPKLLKASERI
jgi:hypothetical protein